MMTNWFGYLKRLRRWSTSVLSVEVVFCGRNDLLMAEGLVDCVIMLVDARSVCVAAVLACLVSELRMVYYLVGIVCVSSGCAWDVVALTMLLLLRMARTLVSVVILYWLECVDNVDGSDVL